jgi:enoyl-CoA hydratase/carnithine racemase
MPFLRPPLILKAEHFLFSPGRTNMQLVGFERQGDVGVFTIDVPNKKVNVLSQSLFADLATAIDECERAGIGGLLVRSGKAGQFIAGADLSELAPLSSATKEEADAALDVGRRVFARLAALPFPTVALIDGPCLGGGLETTLALDDRIASDNPKTLLGTPEVKVGLIPGWGATQRLPRLIALDAAARMLVEGNPISASAALELGLVSAVTPAGELLETGVQRIAELQRTGAWKVGREKLANARIMDCEERLAKLEPETAAARVALQTLIAGLRLPLVEGLAIERTAFSDILRTPAAAAAIRAFLERGKK